jgi:hypothetical protein
MGEIREVMDIIYNKFFLRDIFGKMVPGFLFCSTMYPWAEKFDFLPNLNMNTPMVIVLMGFSWIMGFCIQSFGEWIHLIRYYPKSKNRLEFYEEYIKFLGNASEFEKQNVERLVVIKEACGNLSISILATAILLNVFIINSQGIKNAIGFFVGYWSLYVVATLIFIFLLRMHRKHVQRQYDFMKIVLKNVKEVEKKVNQ